MKKTFSGNLNWGRVLLALLIAPWLYQSCGKNGTLPTSSTDSSYVTKAQANAVTANTSVTATAGGAWVNTSFTSQSADFITTFTASPSASPTNGIIALSNAAQTAYASFAALVRFNPSGDIDAYDNGAANYVSPSTAVPYKAGSSYTFTVSVHTKAQTYDVSVVGPSGTSQVIGTGLKFRASASSLNNYGAYVSTTGGSGTMSVSAFSVQSATPTVTPTFTVTNTATTAPSGISAVAGGAWVNTGFTSQTTDFTADFDASVSSAPNNAIVALSNGAQTAYANFPALVRFNTSGIIDAYNETIANYATPVTSIAYKAGTIYHFTLTLHLASQTYDVSVGGSVIGTGLKFRASATSLNNYGLYIGTGGAGSLTVGNFVVATLPPATPTYTFTLTNTATWTNTPTNTHTPTITNTPTNTGTPTSTFTKTATPVPPTATPTSSALKITFSQWYLQEPSGSGNDVTTRANTWLEAGNSDSYFYKAGDGWQAYTDVNPGITTSGSQHPRCEMHEETTWGTGGTNTLTVTGKATLIDGNTTTVGQIFNNNEGTLVELQYSKNLNGTGKAGFQVFYEEVKGSGSYPTQTVVYVPMNTAYTYVLALSGGVAKITVNGTVMYTHTLSSSVSGDQFYFKAGNYDQSATGTTSSSSVGKTPYSTVEIGSAVIVHK